MGHYIFHYDTLFNINENISRILFENLNGDTKRWKNVLENIDKFSKEYCIKFLDKLILLDKNIFTDEERLSTSLGLREKIHNHKRFSDSPYWQISEECLKKLEDVFYYIEPDSLIYKYYHLFGNSNVNLLNPIPDDIENESNYEKEEKLIEDARKNAISDILKNEGFDKVIEIIKMSEMPEIIGRLLYKITGDKYKNKIINWLDLKDGYLNVCAKNYISSMKFDENILDDLNDIQKAEILLAINFDSITFEILKNKIKKSKSIIGKIQIWYYRVEDKEYIKWIFEQFYHFKIYNKCIDFLSHQIGRLDKDDLCVDFMDIANVLIEMNPNEKNLRHHSISKVIKLLQSTDIESETMRLLEWKYLQLKNFDPIYFEKEIISNPKTFVELITFLYLPEKEREEDNDLTEDQIKSMADNSHLLLKRLSFYKDYENIESFSFITLKDWINEAIISAKEVDREKYAYAEIGKLLSKSPNGNDSIFPNEITRDILEEFANEKLRYYFWHNKKYPNGHYSTTRAYDEGGEQEHKLANIHRQDAEKLKFTHPITASLLIKLAKDYEYDAKKEDMRNDL